MFGVILDRNRPRNVVFYGRVSTEHEAQVAALENQMQWYDDIAKRFPNWTVVDKYIDEGITGTQAKKRPAFMKMIEDSATGKFDLIVTREVCRFARNTVDTLTHTRAMRNIGIEVYFVDDNIWTMDGDGELRLTIMATLAQEESRKVSERVKAGQHISREKGIIYGNGNILGYELKRNFDESGKWNSNENSYVINPEQAETVKMIYDLYEQGNGCMKICKALTERKRLTSSGTINWQCHNILKILSNATYKGYIGYNKSQSNNYLEQKRVNNHDEDSYVYKKGDWEPIISEEQWDRCYKIRKSRRRPSLVEDGVVKKVSNRTSADIWVRKLRCSCGSTFRKNRYHKANDGTITYNYVCYNQVNKGKASFRAKNGLDTEGYCDEHPITQWKMDMMGELFLREAWQSRKDDLMLLLEYIKAYYKSEADKDASNNIVFIDSEIDRCNKKLKNLIDIYADGQINKEEFTSMRKTYDDDLKTYTEQKENFEKQRTTFDKCLNDMTAVSKALASMAELSSPEMSEGVLEEVVSSIVPTEKFRYVWSFHLNKTNEDTCTFVADGNKKHPNIHLDDNPVGASDEASEIHNISLLPLAKAYPKKLSLMENLPRRLSRKSNSALTENHN